MANVALKKIYLIICLLSFFNNGIGHDSAITYQIAGGRFGDQMINYYKAKWLSYKYDIPFLYKPFRYSHKMAMHNQETHYTDECLYRYKEKIKLQNGYTLDRNSGTLYESHFDLTVPGWKYYSLDYINDSTFLKGLKKQVKPNFQIDEIVLPTDIITVAVHVRKGSGQDRPLLSKRAGYFDAISLEKSSKKLAEKKYLDVEYPEKAPSEKFYIEQIKKISDLLHNQKIYLYVFTDDKNPQGIIERFKLALNMPNITFDCRKENNLATDYVLDDFFAMTQFDCLIRPNSNFSKCAELLGDYKIVIYLKNASWIDNELVVDDVGIKMNMSS